MTRAAKKTLSDPHPVERLVAPHASRRRHARVLMVRSRHVLGRFGPAIKRSLDIAVSGTLLILGSPFLALVALAVKLDSPGPVFFRQRRVGERGQTFDMWKFRSMVPDAEAKRSDLEQDGTMSGGIRFKLARDPRITRVGRIIRALSIDELPQLWNVLRGDMTLVGPRPPIPKEVAAYDLEARRRLDGRPGLTCIWQVSGRSLIPFPQQVRMDIDYLHRQCMRLDLKLLLRTIPAVLFRRGAC